MSVTLAPPMFLQFFNPNNSGSPAVAYQLFTYAAGTSTKQATWTDSTQTSENANPLELDGNGVGNFWGDPTLAYKLVWAPANDTDPPTSPIRTVDNLYFPINIGALTQAILGSILYPRIAAESAAGVTPVNYAYAPYDIRRYYSGSGSIDSALASAISVCKQAGGGRIRLPAGSYTSSASINLSSTYGIILEGDGTATGGAGDGTTLTYIGTGSSAWITLTGSLGIQIRNMDLKHSNSGFTGAMIKCGNDGTSDCTNCSLLDLIMDAGQNTAYHLDLDKTIDFSAERVYFAGGATSVKGQSNAGGSYSNSNNFRSCLWANTISTPVNYGGQAWSFDGCTFEGVATGVVGQTIAGAFAASSLSPCSGLSFRGCWLGDATFGGGTWISIAGSPGFVLIGNYISGEASNTFAITLVSVGGAIITGNAFVNLTVALNLATGASKGLVYHGNSFNGVTTPLSGSGSFGDGATSQINPNNPNIGSSGGLAPYFDSSANGYEWTVNGMLDQCGTQLVTAGTPVTVTFPKAFPTACRNVQVTEVAPDAGITDVFVASIPTTTQVILNARGTGNVIVNWRAKGV